MRRGGLLVIAAIMALAPLTMASAQQPIVGTVPGPNSIALLVTGEATTATALVDALEARGCNVSTVGVVQGGGWRMYIAGAPASVNAGFPSLAADQPFFVRCGEGGSVTLASVTGTVTYLERIALPDSAVLTVSLLDISRQDVPAGVVATKDIPTNGAQVPLSFSLDYNPADIVATGTYSVRAEIRVDGDLWFTTDTAALVITQGNPTHVDLTLRRSTGEQTNPIVGREWEWVATRTGGQEVTPATPDEFILTLQADGTAGAQTDCNTFGGSYTIDGSDISIEFLIQTLIACPETSQEQVFIEAVESAVSFTTVDGGDTLILTLPGGSANNMTFEAR